MDERGMDQSSSQAVKRQPLIPEVEIGRFDLLFSLPVMANLGEQWEQWIGRLWQPCFPCVVRLIFRTKPTPELVRYVKAEIKPFFRLQPDAIGAVTWRPEIEPDLPYQLRIRILPFPV